jgi:ATP/ADP translocase
MAKAVKKRSVKTTKKTFVSPFSIYWDKTNYILLFAGILFVIVGFYLMSIGNWDSTTSLVISPIILFIGYVIIFPLSILFRKKESAEVTENSTDKI